jgi:RNase P/RNase MRP subunit POP5
MTKLKKKLNVIRPTLRHKKLYIKIEYTKESFTKISSLILKNYQSIYGLIHLVNANITIMNSDNKTALIRINKDYKDSFLGSIFFLKSDLGLVYVIKQASTLKSIE